MDRLRAKQYFHCLSMGQYGGLDNQNSRHGNPVHLDLPRKSLYHTQNKNTAYCPGEDSLNKRKTQIIKAAEFCGFLLFSELLYVCGVSCDKGKRCLFNNRVLCTGFRGDSDAGVYQRVFNRGRGFIFCHMQLQ